MFQIAGRASFQGTLRIDADSGLTGLEATRFEGTLPVALSLLWIDLRWPDLLPRLDLQAGRLFLADAADFVAVDGVRLVYRTPLAGLQLGALGGIEAKTFSPPSSALYELDGVRGVYDRRPEPTPLSPVVGLEASYERLPYGDLRIAWRRMLRTASTAEQQEVPASLRQALYLEADQVSGSGSIAIPGGWGRAYAGGAYDLGRGQLTRGLIGVTGTVAEPISLVVEGMRQEPSFALSSIWTYFSHQALDELSAGAVARLGPVRLDGRGFVRALRSPKAIERNTPPDATDAEKAAFARPLDQLGVRQAWGGRLVASAGGRAWSVDAGASGHVVVPAEGITGGGGRRITVDAGGRWAFIESLSAEARATWVAFDDEVRPAPDGTTPERGYSVGASAGLNWRIRPEVGLSAVVEENFTSLEPLAPPRVFAFFDWRVGQ